MLLYKERPGLRSTLECIENRGQFKEYWEEFLATDMTGDERRTSWAQVLLTRDLSFLFLWVLCLNLVLTEVLTSRCILHRVHCNILNLKCMSLSLNFWKSLKIQLKALRSLVLRLQILVFTWLTWFLIYQKYFACFLLFASLASVFTFSKLSDYESFCL